MPYLGFAQEFREVLRWASPQPELCPMILVHPACLATPRVSRTRQGVPQKGTVCTVAAFDGEVPKPSPFMASTS